ncbi:hypothetical protein GGR51DRAFT_560771 [Nemania sp. FL0031]|nr:hypothetical protein GGR51DRAFT_560771 [Nemania sp. FL0031]
MEKRTLLTLPREIRDSIYHFIFAGSRLHFRPGFSTRPGWFRVAGDVDILFTCKMCYEEGRIAFWDEVHVYGWEGWPQTTIYDLSIRLSDLARSRIRHIRNLRGDNNHRPDETRLGLARFPRLRTCEFHGSPIVVGVTESILLSGDDETLIDFAVSRQFANKDPHRLLARWNIDPKAYKVQFLMRFTLFNLPTPHAAQFTKSMWVNMTTQKYFTRDCHGIEPYEEREKCFRRVLV